MMLVALRTCDADMQSRGGFQWPGVGETVTAPDWVDSQECGGGLHGLLWGQGDWSLLATDDTGKWVVFKPVGGISHLGGNIKCESAEVLFIGARLDAWQFLRQHVTDLRGANLRGADLRDADLGYANLGYANLRYANLRGANLRGANLRDANLRDADLQGANLRGANLGYADLRGANLGYAGLRGADLRDADLQGANLRGADLRDADLGYANLRYANLGYAKTNELTVLPEGVTVPGVKA